MIEVVGLLGEYVLINMRNVLVVPCFARVFFGTLAGLENAQRTHSLKKKKKKKASGWPFIPIQLYSVQKTQYYDSNV